MDMHRVRLHNQGPPMHNSGANVKYLIRLVVALVTKRKCSLTEGAGLRLRQWRIEKSVLLPNLVDLSSSHRLCSRFIPDYAR